MASSRVRASRTEYNRQYQAALPPEKLRAYRAYNAEHRRNYRATRTPEERAADNARSCEMRRDRIAALSPEAFAARKERLKLWAIRKNYGLSPEDFAALCVQFPKCAICSSEHDLHIDHDHTTNLVRGRLCSTCNKALGLFRDNRVLLQGAITYLETSGDK